MPGRSLKLNIREPVSGITLSAEPAFILVIATVVLATAAVLGPDNVRMRAKTADKNLQHKVCHHAHDHDVQQGIAAANRSSQ